MTKWRNISLIILLLSFLVAIPEADAQRKRKRKKRRDKDKQEQVVPFHERLWYGGGFGLGFGGDQFSSIFQMGISPMVGYKVTNKLSFGPRVDIQYTTGRIDGGTEIFRLNAVNYGAGVFGRYKFLETFFLHTEFGFLDYVQNIAAPDPGDRNVKVFRAQESQAFVGLGYNSSAGGVWGTEFSLLYNLLAPDDQLALPIDFRFGITYKF